MSRFAAFSAPSLTALGIAGALLACGGQRPPSSPARSAIEARPPGLVLQVGEGERRVRRTNGVPFIFKVDRLNGGSPELVMGYEDLAPGFVIPPHHHPGADEILFIHRGSGVAILDERETPVTAGATIYIPRNVRVSLRNTGADSMALAFFFSRPGFDQYMREISVPDREPVTKLSPEELARIRHRHEWNTTYEQP